ncbi:unnamed protein product [Amoebophrya sp. A120]|nr:unnamed protein product [Amoebophrya sp. A120]|eukprot:GSA120T00006301001.1
MRPWWSCALCTEGPLGQFFGTTDQTRKAKNKSRSATSVNITVATKNKKRNREQGTTTPEDDIGGTTTSRADRTNQRDHQRGNAGRRTTDHDRQKRTEIRLTASHTRGATRQNNSTYDENYYGNEGDYDEERKLDDADEDNWGEGDYDYGYDRNDVGEEEHEHPLHDEDQDLRRTKAKGDPHRNNIKAKPANGSTTTTAEIAELHHGRGPTREQESSSSSSASHSAAASSSSATTAAIEVRSEEEILELVNVIWIRHVHSRTWDAFQPESSVYSLLAAIAKSVPRFEDPILGGSDKCVEWCGEYLDSEKHGASATAVVSGKGRVEKNGIKQVPTSAGNDRNNTRVDYPVPQRQPCLGVQKTDKETKMYANRILAFVFAADESFQKLAKLGRDPLPMKCRNPRCVNLAHVDV